VARHPCQKNKGLLGPQNRVRQDRNILDHPDCRRLGHRDRETPERLGHSKTPHRAPQNQGYLRPRSMGRLDQRMQGRLDQRKQAPPDLHNKDHLDPHIPYNCIRRARRHVADLQALR
jgi:hypothetical protein